MRFVKATLALCAASSPVLFGAPLTPWKPNWDYKREWSFASNSREFVPTRGTGTTLFIREIRNSKHRVAIQIPQISHSCRRICSAWKIPRNLEKIQKSVNGGIGNT